LGALGYLLEAVFIPVGAEIPFEAEFANVNLGEACKNVHVPIILGGKWVHSLHDLVTNVTAVLTSRNVVNMSSTASASKVFDEIPSMPRVFLGSNLAILTEMTMKYTPKNLPLLHYEVQVPWENLRQVQKFHNFLRNAFGNNLLGVTLQTNPSASKSRLTIAIEQVHGVYRDSLRRLEEDTHSFLSRAANSAFGEETAVMTLSHFAAQSAKASFVRGQVPIRQNLEEQVISLHEAMQAEAADTTQLTLDLVTCRFHCRNFVD
jgi:hypothetical protein